MIELPLLAGVLSDVKKLVPADGVSSIFSIGLEAVP
jgi:hypothetical protein